MKDIIFTIGHSTHQADDFINLLHRHNISLVCDVRSQPYSKYSNQFNKESIKKTLLENRIEYLFLGEELGARSKNRSCYDKNKLQFHLLAKDPLFKSGLDKVLRKVKEHRVVLMCSEAKPLDCHRTILVCRELYKTKNFLKDSIQHILADGSLKTHTEIEKDLLKKFKLDHPDMFNPEEKRMGEVYNRQGQKIAYTYQEDLLEGTRDTRYFEGNA